MFCDNAIKYAVDQITLHSKIFELLSTALKLGINADYIFVRFIFVKI